MKFKRGLSLILAFCMMISLLPAMTVSALDTSPETLEYVFSMQAAGTTNRKNEYAYWEVSRQTYDRIEEIGVSPDKWAFVDIVGHYGSQLENGSFQMATRNYTEGNNGVALKIHVKEGADGMYMPTLSYLGHVNGAKLSVYLVPTTAANASWAAVSTGAVSDYLTNADTKVVKLIDSVNTHVATEADITSFSKVYPVNGTAPIELSAGDYYVIFSATGAAEGVSATSSRCYYIRPAGLTFTKVNASLTASCDVTEIEPDGETQIEVSTIGYDGNPIAGTVSYTSSVPAVATVDSDGKVVGKSEGKTTITASVTYEGQTYSDTVEITVVPKDEGNAGKTFEYILGTMVMSDSARAAAQAEENDGDEDRGLDAKGNLRDMSFMSDYSHISDNYAKWVWSDLGTYGKTGLTLGTNMLMVGATYASYGTDAQEYLPIKIKVPNRGEYNISLDYSRAETGAGADVYFIPAAGVDAITRADLVKTSDNYVCHIETNDMDTSGYKELGKLNLSRGDYYVVFDFNTTNNVLNKGRNYFYPYTLKLVAASGEFDKLSFSLRGIEDGNETLALSSFHKINLELTDKAGMPLDDIDENKLTKKEITSDDEDVVRITEDGYAEAVGIGSTTLHATVEYDGIERTASLPVTVALEGDNLMENLNPGLDNDMWIWDMARTDDGPTEPWWISAKLGVAPKEDDENNRAFGVVFNPEVSVYELYGKDEATGKYGRPPTIAFARSATGPRIKVKSGQFYQFSFMVKFEDWQLPEGAYNPEFAFDIYPYASKDATKSIAGYNRTVDITKESEYIEKYSNGWVKVTLPVAAPFTPTDEDVYMTPVFVFRPNNADYEKKGFGGTVWFDDFELREVGFDRVEVTYDGAVDSGVKGSVNIIAQALAANGTPISISTDSVPGCIKFNSSDTYVLGEVKDITAVAESTSAMNYRAQGTSKLGGKNGKTTVSAEMTLHGITRSAEKEIEVKNFDIELLYAEAEAEDETVEVGETTQIITRGYLTDGKEADLSKAQIVYTSETPDIISVDDSGKITALNPGHGSVRVTVVLNGVGYVVTVPVTAADSSLPIEGSFVLSAPESVGFLRDAKLTITGKMESGRNADIDYNSVVWYGISENGITVDEAGYAFGCKLGAVADIYAELTINGKTVTTNTVTMTVSESDLRDYLIDFRETKKTNAADLTIEEDGWMFSELGAKTRPALTGNFVHTMDTAPGQSFSIKTNIPYTGVYNLILSGRAYGTYASSSTYLYVDGVYAGDYCFYNEGNTALSPTRTLRAVYLTAGEHEITFMAMKGAPKDKMQCHTQLITLLFSARHDLPAIKEIKVDDLALALGQTKPLDAALITEDGFSYEWQEPIKNGVEPVTVSYSVKEGDVVTIDVAGNVTAVKEGNAVVTVTATYNGETVSRDITVTVTSVSAENDPTLASIDITYKSLVLSTNSEGLPLGISAKNAAGVELPTDGMTVLWESSDTAVVTVENGMVKPVKEGIADITLTVIQGDAEPKTDTVTVSVRAGKTKRTYYTDEKIANAQENATKYSWAKSIKKSAESAVEKYASLSMDELWSMITGEGIPRTLEVGLKGDPDIYVCRYCGTDVKTTYGVYPWGADALARPWKIQCQACKRLFPSNDFEKLYELGLDERGIYDADKAREENARLVAESDGKINYLKNTMYPEIAENVTLTGNETVEGWGVDAGFGYDTGRTYSNGIREVHTYIPYYHHWAIWYSSAPYHSASAFDAIKSLSEAYIYTGDEKYGRLGAVMVDRLADVYPEYSLDQWIDAGYSNGSTKNGKTINNIWEAINGKIYARAYDAFFPFYDDPEVLSFLQAKAEQYDIGDKSNAEAIRSNIEENLLWELYEGATILDVHGNFGHHQSAIATAAVVLDTQPQTQTMIDWVFAHSESLTNYDNSGGGVNSRIVNDVSRDGQGTESGTGYNRIWARELVDLANDLAGYDGYDGIDLWENAKYIQMFKVHAPLTMVERGTLPIGDTGSNAHYFPLPDMMNGVLNAYQNSKENHPESAIELAQLYYQMTEETGSSLSDAHFDIFTKNPESVQDEIEEIIETYGEYDFNKSMILTGYGLAALKDGKLYDGGGSTGVRDTTRDFWIYFGGAKSHNHFDTLNLGMEAYGISISPDNGYPEMTGHDPNRHQWTNTTIAHNAVVVNEKSSNKLYEPAKPLHFDAKDTRVKVMDVEAPDAYGVTDEYRRTVVMVDYDDEISYGIDFFKVHGGDDHLYSFHASSEVIDSYSDNLNFYIQPGGTYAGIEAAFGNDPYTNQGDSNAKLKYPHGYTWLYDVMRADNAGVSEFWVDYKIKDIVNISRNPKSAMDIHLRVTMLNDFELDEVTFAKGKPPRTTTNLRYMTHMNYLLARRKGKSLDTLFTTVLEPYNKTRYVSEISQVDITPLEDIRERDKAKAVKVELTDGRIDYVVYAQDDDVTYRITDADTGYSFDFRGFVGVWTVRENETGDGYENVYNYINDGDVIGDAAYEAGAVCGEVADFTRKLEFDNFIEVKFDEPFLYGADTLSDRMINVEYEGLGNAAYLIENATLSEDGLSATLDIGSVTPIASYADNYNPNAGFNYDIAVGDRFEIALSHEDNKAPIFEETSHITTSAGSSVSVTVSAESPAESGNTITYVARTLPRGGSFNPQTATFTWKPDDSQVGDNLVAIDAVDDYGRSSTSYFTVTVYGKTTGGSAEKNEAPSTDSSGTSGEGAGSGGGGGGGGGGGAAPDNGNSSDQTDDGDGTSDVTPDENTDETENTVPDASGETDNIRFTDLANCTWAADAINALAADGIIKGTTASTFSPAANITRADFALLLVRAFKLTSDNTENFADVTAADYFASELAIARNTGIIGGIGENKYAPRNNITRQDMMVIVYRALQKLGVELGIYEEPEYADFTTVAPYARDAVSTLIGVGLVNGKSGRIAPLDYTTRAEVAVLIKRILDFVS